MKAALSRWFGLAVWAEAQKNRVPVEVELQAQRKRDYAWYDLHPRGAAIIREFNLKPRDPIIEELHRVREDIGKAHDFDVRRIAAAVREHEDENPAGVIRESPQRTTRQKKAS